MGYVAYESNVQDAFAASAPSTSAPKSIKGRQNIWGGDGYGEDENLHPGDPLPIGDHTILFIFAALAAVGVFIKQRKRKHATTQRLLTLAACTIATSAALAQTEGDYRLCYVEQTVLHNDIRIDYSITSDIIPLSATDKEDTVSLHIYNEYKLDGTEIYNGINNPEIILQQYTGGTWVDKECYMVFGPLQIKNDGSVIKLPGRKNAGEGSDIDDFVHDSGIPAII